MMRLHLTHESREDARDAATAWGEGRIEAARRGFTDRFEAAEKTTKGAFEIVLQILAVILSYLLSQ